MSNEVISTERGLGRVEGKVDLILTELTALRSIVDSRLGSVEKKVWYGSGIAATVGMFLGAKLGLSGLH